MSIKKCSLIAIAAVAASMAMASSASADLGASLTTAKATPSTGLTAGKASTGGLFLDVTNCEAGDASCTGSGGTAPTQVLAGVDMIKVQWSTEVKIPKPKNPTCASGTISALTYKAAMLACNGSVLGSGGATVCLGGTVIGSACSAVQADTIVFRAPDFTDPDLGGGVGFFGKAGKIYPALNLYADIGVGTAVVPAVLTPADKDSKLAGYKTSLNVFGSGDPVTPPSQSITDFWANVGAKVKCPLGTTNIQYRSLWLSNVHATKSDTDSQACTAA